MKSRVNMRESFDERKLECIVSERMRLARSLALATAVTLILQPLTMTAFAKEQTETKTSARFGNIFSKNHSDARSSKVLIVEKDEADGDDDAPKKAEPKKDAKKETDKKDAKETAKEAAAEKKAQDKAKKEAAKNAKIEEKQEKAKAQAKAKTDTAKKVEPKKADDKSKAKGTADDADKTAKKKKGGWFNRPKGAADDDEIVVVEEEIVEVAEPARKAPEAKPGAATKTPAGSTTKTTIVTPAKPAAGAAVQAPSSEAVATEKPVLLPDNALVSVLQDISKSLGEANETSGIETADDKVIVSLARQVLDRSLDSGELKDNRILAPEHNNTAKNTMTTEAWTSGDVVISDKLRGSVATVWGKRINGMLHVTIAGECQNKTLSNGEKVGEFIVVIKGHSPVKSGFDIQSQADVTYWIGAIDSVNVEAACSRLKEKSAEGETEPGSPTKSVDIKGEVKKKSPVVLDTVLTHRRLEYLRAMALYQVQQQLLAQQLADESMVEQAVATTVDTDRGAAGDEVAPAKRKLEDDVDGERIASRTRSSDTDEDQRTTKRDADEEDDDDDDDEEPANVSKRNVSENNAAPKAAAPSDDKADDDKARRASDRGDTKVSDRSSVNNDNDVTKKSDKATSEKVASHSNASADRDSDGDKNQGSSDKDPDHKRVGSISKRTDDNDSDGRSSDTSNKTAAKSDNAPIKQPLTTVATSAKPKNAPGDSSKMEKNPWTNKPIDDKVDSTQPSQNNASAPDSPSSKWPSTISTDASSSSPNPGAVNNTTAVVAKSDPAWKDDWSRDGGDSTLTTTVQNSPTSTSTPTAAPATTPNLTRISIAIPTPAPAQASSRAWESPALNLAPRSPSLGANLLYPERAIAGQFLTVSVLAKDRQPERSVELSFNGATISTDLNGQALYMIPEDMPPGQTLHISLAERPELSSKVVDVLQQLDEGSAPRRPRIDKVSPLVASDGVLVIDGHEFDGFADKNRIVIDNGVDAKVIASSPVQLRILIPGKILPGTHTVTITDANLKSTPAKFEFIKAEVEQPDVRKTKGTLDRIVVRIHGTRQPVPVRVVNRTPDVIKISRGDNLLITTPGGNDNSSVLGVKQLKKGDYKVEASIEI